nr:DUF4345 family protein [Pseudomonas flavescens]
MSLARVYLVVQLLLLGAAGILYGLWPHEMASLSGMLMMESAAVTDVRARYGGLPLGLALFLGLAAWHQALLRPALILLLVLYAGLALARLTGIVLDGGAQQTFNLWAILFELLCAAAAAWLLRAGR